MSVTLDSLSAWAYRRRLVTAVAVVRAVLAKVDAVRGMLRASPASVSSPRKNGQVLDRALSSAGPAFAHAPLPELICIPGNEALLSSLNAF